MQRTSIPLALAFGPQGCMDEVKGRVVAACCLDDTVPLFEGVKGFVYIKAVWQERRTARTRGCANGRMRGSPCPEAWVCPVPEPVGLKVWANPHQSQPSCSRRAGWKRGRTAQNSPFFRRGSLQVSRFYNTPRCSRARVLCVGLTWKTLAWTQNSASENEKEHVMKFINVRLLVGDITAAIKFWRDVMGLRMSYGDEAMGYAYFETDSAGVE